MRDFLLDYVCIRYVFLVISHRLWLMAYNMARLSILSNNEINALYTLPMLGEEDRSYLFELDNQDRLYIDSTNSITQKINYILQLGYYRAVSYFFRFTFQEVKEDVHFILQEYFPTASFPKQGISKHIHYKNRNQVCKKYNIQDVNPDFLRQLDKEARRLVTIHMLPKCVLTGLLSFCQHKFFIKPAYSTFQAIISGALKFEKNRLSNKLYLFSDKSLRAQLDNLLKKDDIIYSLTLLKKEQLNFSTTEIKQTIDKQKSIVNLYGSSKQLVKQLGISEQNIIYYSDLAQFYTIQRLRTFRSKNQPRLYLLCYVTHRLRKINDQLISSFIQKMLSYQKQADEYQKKQIEAAQATDKQLRNQAHKIMLVNVNDKIPDAQVRGKAFEILPKAEYIQFLSDFKRINFSCDFYRWQFYGKIAQKMKRNLRPIFKVIEFSCEHVALHNAVQFLHRYICTNKPFQDYPIDDIPLDFFPKSLKRFIMKKSPCGPKNSIDGDRYEFMVYWQIQKGLNDTSVHIRDSYCYRALEDELIDIEHWTTHKKQILEGLNMPLLSTNIVDVLSILETSIENKYQQVSHRIVTGENASIKLKYNDLGEVTSWTLPYTPMDDGTNNLFFKQLPTQNISDIAQFVDGVTGYSRAFTHLQPIYAKEQPDIEAINACVIANATGTEIKKMIDISDIDSHALKQTQKTSFDHKP